MSFRYFIALSYKGKNYHGWQIQPNAHTVQAELNEKLSLLLKSSINTVGAGRTDTGVHARFFVAHFDSAINLDSELQRLKEKLNSFLPDDITVNDIYRVPENAHARFSALSRTYRYYISQKKDVFNSEFMWELHYKLDVEMMNKGAGELLNYSDFTSFSKLHSDVKTKLCKVESAIWRQEDDVLVFEIVADRFLRNMVRSIVGTLVLLGRHKITLLQFQQIIEARDRSLAGESAPAHALFLTAIAYPEKIISRSV